MIELRSDTFTLPSPAMRSAMAVATLGDDGYGEDPTVSELEELASSIFRKDASCLMPSGTMANMAALKAHASSNRQVVLMGDESDLSAFEIEEDRTRLGMSHVPLPTNADGTISRQELKDALDMHGNHLAAIAIENPHSLRGGIVLPQAFCAEIYAMAHDHGAKLHLDGARIFNAAVASGAEPHHLVRHADSLQFCLSKGLAAPVGSMVVGDFEFIERVRHIRRRLGGTMRQAGIIAAPGIVALKEMIPRLAEDHDNALKLATGLARIPGISVDLKTVQTNTVVFSVAEERFTSDNFIAAAKLKGVHLSDFRYGRVRAVVHYGITTADVTEALKRLREVMANEPGTISAG